MHKNNFDFLRFFFAFIVVLGHIVTLSASGELAFLAKYFDTHLCVTGFFVISGFLIVSSYLRTSSTKSYFVKRANRLLPGYIFLILVSAIGLAMLSTLDAGAYFSNKGVAQYLAANLTFLNFLHPCLPGVFEQNKICAVNGALWTIKVEVTFYLLLPLVVYLINRTSRKLLLFGAIYLSAIAYKLVLQYYYNKTGSPIFTTLANQLPAFMNYFISGIAISYMLPLFLKWKNRLILPAIIIFGIEYYFQVEYLLPLSWAIIVLFVAFSFPKLNGFGKYGDFSYGIYIFHFPIVQLFIALGLFVTFNPWLTSIVIIVLVMILAVLSWNFLEKRFLKRKNKAAPGVSAGSNYSASTIKE
jgi:peptidoglycan/LPS O-acetylase OafA/YrhL